jgi:hypothetical protein
MVESDPLGRALREIDAAAVYIRSAIIDPHHHRAASAKVGDLHARPERQTA